MKSKVFLILILFCTVSLPAQYETSSKVFQDQEVIFGDEMFHTWIRNDLEDTCYYMEPDKIVIGTWTAYYDSIKTKKAFQTRFENFINLGPERTWYRSGQLRSLVKYATTQYGRRGKGDYIETERTVWYSDGSLKLRHYRDDYLIDSLMDSQDDFEDTLFTFIYYPSGQLKRKHIQWLSTYFIDESYYPDGKVKSHADSFSVHHPYPVTFYHQNGSTSLTCYFIYNPHRNKTDTIGDYLEYYPSGKLKTKGKYVLYNFPETDGAGPSFSKKAGVWEYYDETGGLVKKKKYKIRKYKNHFLSRDNEEFFKDLKVRRR